MKKQLSIYLSLLVFFVLIAIFVYPTIYHYDKLEQKYPVRINRITGKTEVLYRSGWSSLPDEKKTVENNTLSTSTASSTGNRGSGLISIDDFEKSNIQKITKKTDLNAVDANELKIDDNISISKIKFSGRYVTGIIANTSSGGLLISSIDFETYDKSGNVLPQQPGDDKIGDGPFAIVKTGENTIFSEYLYDNASSVGNFKIKIDYSTGY